MDEYRFIQFFGQERMGQRRRLKSLLKANAVQTRIAGLITDWHFFEAKTEAKG